MSKYTVKAPVSFTGTGWGLAFVDGVAQTDDDYLADKLQGKGYTVTRSAPQEPPDLVCPVCQKSYKTEKGLREHLTKEHPDYQPEA